MPIPFWRQNGRISYSIGSPDQVVGQLVDFDARKPLYGGQVLDAEVGDSEVPDLAFLLQTLECADRVGERDLPVWPVDQVEVDVVGAEPGQASLARLLDLFGQQVYFGHLARDHNVFTPASQGPPEHGLRSAGAVAFRRVDEIDAVFQRGVDGGDRVFVVLFPERFAARERPCPQREFRDFDAGCSELPVFHESAPIETPGECRMLLGLGDNSSPVNL